MKHTPGPWNSHFNEKTQPTPSWWSVITRGGQPVCEVLNHDESNEANAHLISAAPDLLEASHAALKLLRGSGFTDGCATVTLLLAAINKAEKQ